MTLIAVDWGNSALRGARIDAAGQVLQKRSAARGILTVPANEFPAVFNAHFGDWMQAPDSRCLISGMAGSRQGWVEAPYCACPADAQAVAEHCIDIVPGRIAMVPGLRDLHDGVPDVMRGEEVQIFGAMALTGLDSGLFVLPGTHSKWVRVLQGQVMGFRTFMTGEFFGLLAQHSILARSVKADAALDEGSFIQGVQRARHSPGGLLHHAFGTRTLGLFHQMQEAALSSYLSGLLIGEELQAQALLQQETVVLIGSPLLTERYALALQVFDLPVRTLGAEATWAGAHVIHQARAFLRH